MKLFTIETINILVDINGVVFWHEHIHVSQRVTSKTVGITAALPKILDIIVGKLVGERIRARVGSEILGFDGVYVVRCERREIHDLRS